MGRWARILTTFGVGWMGQGRELIRDRDDMIFDSVPAIKNFCGCFVGLDFFIAKWLARLRLSWRPATISGILNAADGGHSFRWR